MIRDSGRGYCELESAIEKLKKEFPTLSEQEVWQVMGLCVSMYGAKETEKAELAITAPISFKLKARKIHEVVENMLRDSKKVSH